jgi:CheY-like chemotaxis protein
MIFSHIRMPEMNGEEKTRRIRRGETLDPKVSIVALTAHALKGDRERFMAAGMDDYLSKPINLEDLSQVLAWVINKRGTAK